MYYDLLKVSYYWYSNKQKLGNQIITQFEKTTSSKHLTFCFFGCYQLDFKKESLSLKHDEE
jgi:hypothetical protein